MLLRERFWLWGHPEGAFNEAYGLSSRMTPMECCGYLGIGKTFMVPMDHVVNRRQYNMSFKSLQAVGWECFKAGTNPELIEPLIQEAQEFSNISCVVFDDFKNDEGQGPRYKQTPLENLKRIRDRLHHNEVRSLDSWMVIYTYLFGINEEEDKEFQPYMDVFDGVIMWTWKESDVPLIPEKYEIFKRLTPNNRRMFGCYLWNFGEGKEATGEAVKWQLDFYREKILSGEAEGVVLHTNTMADLDYEAYAAALEWMAEHGDEIVPDLD